MHHPGRLRPHLADRRRLLAALDAPAARPARGATASGATNATRRPSLATYIGSIPSSSAAAATTGVDRHVRLADDDGHAGRARELVEHRGDAAAGRVAHAVKLLAGRAEQRVDRRPQRARVGLDLGVELELVASEHDRRAVLADRAGHEDAVAGADRLGREPGAGIDRPDAGRAQVHAVGGAALDDLRVAADDLDAGRVRRRGDRLDLGAQHARARVPPRGSSTR